MLRLDKLHHVVYTVALALAGALLFGVGWGLALALLVGAAKELCWDGYLGRGHPDWQDMAANAVGLVVAWAILARAGI